MFIHAALLYFFCIIISFSKFYLNKQTPSALPCDRAERFWNDGYTLMSAPQSPSCNSLLQFDLTTNIFKSICSSDPHDLLRQQHRNILGLNHNFTLATYLRPTIAVSSLRLALLTLARNQRSNRSYWRNTTLPYGYDTILSSRLLVIFLNSVVASAFPSIFSDFAEHILCIMQDAH